MLSAELIVPGRLDTLTGGYGYDRRIVEGLRQRGWAVTVHELDGGFPSPSPAARRHAVQVLAAVPDKALVVIDGLAFGVMAAEVAPHSARLCIVALVHHPLAAEAGLSAGDAAGLHASERKALALARLVIVTSDGTAGMLTDYGVPTEQIVVINPGTDPAPAARGSEGAGVELLCVGTLIPRKGHEVLFRALASLPVAPDLQASAGRHGRWRLTCVGSLDRDPATVARLRAQLARDGLAEEVSFTGEMDGPSLAHRYDAADVFVLPTLFEGYGMVVAEAIARGLPVIASRTGAIPDLVSTDAGILVPPGDVQALAEALCRVIGNATLRARLAHGARLSRSRLQTWEQSCARMASTLQWVGA
jgi:glycosyltransferase involved in cell wall biosynthesis